MSIKSRGKFQYLLLEGRLVGKLRLHDLEGQVYIMEQYGTISNRGFIVQVQ